MARPVLEMIGITKCFRSNWTFRTFCAVDDLSFSIEEGEVYGLIGHNGAGKTTTFKLLVGLLRPTQGALIWSGARLGWNQPRTGLGFSPEQPYFYDYLTVRETLAFYGQLYGLNHRDRRERVAALAERFHIAHKLDAPMRTLSKGTLQRVAVAQAIMHRPRLAILDEPMSGLDPSGRKEMRDLIRSLKHDGTTVLFSSHILSDAESLCDRVGILATGRLREVVEIGNTLDTPIGYTVIASAVAPQSLAVLSRVATEPPSGGPQRWSLHFKDQAAVRLALAELHGTEACIEALLPERRSLEQRFLQYVPLGADVD